MAPPPANISQPRIAPATPPQFDLFFLSRFLLHSFFRSSQTKQLRQPMTATLVLIQVDCFHIVSSFPMRLLLRRKSSFRSTGPYQNRSTKLFFDKKCKNSVTSSQSIACKKLISILLTRQRSTENTNVSVCNAKSSLKKEVSPASFVLLFFIYLSFVLWGN